MRILWYSYAPWTRYSYSSISRQMLPVLLDAGHEIVYGGLTGHHGAPIPYAFGKYNLSVYGYLGVDGHWGDTAALRLWDMAHADCAIMCADIWRIPPDAARYIKRLIQWIPVHHSPETAYTLDCAKAAHRTLVYSVWGQAVLEAAGAFAEYAPVPCDSGIWHYEPGARKALGLSDDLFIVSMVGINHNTDAKNYSSALRAFAVFAAQHPEARLYLHTNLAGGIDLARIMQCLDIENRVITPQQNDLQLGLFGEDYMRQVYSASDVLLNSSRWEGFCMPAVEAQLCGTPVIAPDYGATNALIQCGWWLTGELAWFDQASSWAFSVHQDSIVETLERAYIARLRVPEETIAEMANQYSPRTIYENYLKPVLQEVCG